MDPVTVMDGIHKDLQNLDEQGKALHTAMKEASEAEREWELAYAKALLEADGSSKERREAAALIKVQAENQDLYLRHYLKPMEVDRLKTLVRMTQSRLSARQSMLSAMRAEAFANDPGPQVQWSGGKR